MWQIYKTESIFMYILRQKTSDDDEINQIDDNRMIDASGLWLLLAVTNKK